MKFTFFLACRIIILFTCFNLFSCKSAPLNNEIYNKNITYPDGKTRLTLISGDRDQEKLNLFFIPGGPGIGSAYITSLTDHLDISANIWLVDLPGNGDNIQENIDFNLWSKNIANVIKNFKNVIIIGHSFGGMLVLSEPDIFKYSKAMIILNAAPICDSKYLKSLDQKKIKYDLIDPFPILKKFQQNPSNIAYRNVLIELADHYFLKNYKSEAIKLFNNNVYNYIPYIWGVDEFFPNYKIEIIPSIPTLIINGEFDHITPINLIKEDVRFNKPNIKITEIKNAGHFPWIENLEEVRLAIRDFIQNQN